MSNTLIQVKNLNKRFKVPSGYLHAVDNLSFSIKKGKTIGVVGESGCGKSTTGRLMSMLLEPTNGEILFEDQDITKVKSRKKLSAYRKKIQMIFQDPFSSLDPRKTIYQIIAEPFLIHKEHSSKGDLNTKILDLMRLVGLAERYADSYPHELDGGRRQRVGIARALALSPELIICDEPVSALDVSIQAQVLNLLKKLQQQFGYTYMFITHDLSVIKHISDEILVMYLGQMVEKTTTDKLFESPKHPYTQALLSAIPVADIDVENQRVLLKGEVTSPINPKEECLFVSRCPHAEPRCYKQVPPIVEIEKNHFVRCFLVD